MDRKHIVQAAKYCCILFITYSTFACTAEPNNEIDLSGEWQFKIDSLDIGISEGWYEDDYKDRIHLPSSMAESGKGNDIRVNTKWTGQIVDSSWYTDERYAKYRDPENIKIPFWLQPNKHYVGPAWYKRTITIPSSWKNKRIKVFFERCHWESRLWIDGREIGSQNYLATPHLYSLPNLKPGKHSIVVRIDNRVNEIDPGINAHSISDHTQTNWNGMVGKLVLSADPPIYFEDIRLFPDLSNDIVRIKLKLVNGTDEYNSCRLIIGAENNIHQPETIVKDINLDEDQEIELEYPMGNNYLTWDEFNPNLYRMKIELKSSYGSFNETIKFGMREFTIEGTRFKINGRPIFLRGTLECAIFPKTGYPPTEVSEWERILKIIKQHGLNHMRFHSWCPPEAAFIAANRIGIYLQVEASAWANIGNGERIDDWLYNEAGSIMRAYGNHASFCFFAYGNEPSGRNQADFLEKFINHWKKEDPRRVYTAAAGWPAVASMDFYNNYEPRIQRWGEGLNSIINSKPPETNFDYREILSAKFHDKPLISHEIGQWCVYPNFEEIEKYSGVLRAKNFEIFKETLTENNLADLSESFLLASGKLQALCYKADIEAALRTPGMAGFQLLDLHDFPGQGTALVGILDAFWDEKGYITPQEFSKFCNKTVPLARFSKRVFLNDEILNAEAEVAHFGQTELKNVISSWQVKDDSGNTLFEGKFESQNIPLDNNTKLGEIKLNLNSIYEPQKLTLKLEVLENSNSWDFWVYPAKQNKPKESMIHITSVIDSRTINILEQGGSVIFTFEEGKLKDEKGGSIKVGFSSIFWNTAWTKNQAPHTLGILCDPRHPIFEEFPTEYHSNWQWWDVIYNSQAIILNNRLNEIDPILRIIDDWFENRNLGLLFEAKVGKGKIIISGIDLINNLEERVATGQLLHSIKKYILSKEFNPQNNLDIEEIASLIKN